MDGFENPIVRWDPGFGAGLNIFSADGQFERLSHQGSVEVGGDRILYKDEVGLSASITGLKQEELEVLKDKHGL